MIRRTISFVYSFVCYDDREVKKEECTGDKGEKTNWHTQQYDVDFTETKPEFPQSLTRWGDIASDRFEVLLEEEGEKNCEDTADYLHLCYYIYEVVDVVEEIIEEITKVPPGIIEAIKGYEKSAKALREAAGRIPIPELKEDFLKRASELEGKANELRKKYGLIGKEI